MCKGYGMARSLRLVKRIKRIKKTDGTYTSTNSIAWSPGYIDGVMDSATTAIAAPLIEQGFKAWGTKGNIMVESNDINTQINIYSIYGIKIKTVLGTSGIMQIPIKHGFYIVRINGKSKKVVVTE
jgi:hypothetical protein